MVTSLSTWRLQLENGARLYGIDLSERQLAAFALYLRELTRWNRAYNLTRIITPEEVVRAHFLDSFNYLPGLPEKTRRVLDFGSGAGFPGLPLALVRPEIEFVLCEARSKKALFLEHLSRLLQLENVSIEHLHLNRQNAKTAGLGDFQVLVCRAVNLLREVAPVAVEILTPGGYLLFTAARPEVELLERELKRKIPRLVLKSLRPCIFSGRAPRLFLGIIRKGKVAEPECRDVCNRPE